MLNDGNLTIAKLDHSDAGLYECLGLSPVITIIASSYLIIGIFNLFDKREKCFCGN